MSKYDIQPDFECQKTKNQKRKTKIEKRITKNEKRETNNEKQKAKNEKRITKNEKQKTKSEKRKTNQLHIAVFITKSHQHVYLYLSLLSVLCCIIYRID